MIQGVVLFSIQMVRCQGGCERSGGRGQSPENAVGSAGTSVKGGGEKLDQTFGRPTCFFFFFKHRCKVRFLYTQKSSNNLNV